MISPNPKLQSSNEDEIKINIFKYVDSRRQQRHQPNARRRQLNARRQRMYRRRQPNEVLLNRIANLQQATNNPLINQFFNGSSFI